MSYLPPILAFVVALGGTRWLLGSAMARWLVDLPNERSLHSAPTPRGGGLAILAGVLAGGFWVAFSSAAAPPMLWLAVAVLPVAGISLADDLAHVPAGLRLLAHFAAAGLLLAGGLGMSGLVLPGSELALPGALGPLVSALYVVWLVNLYNFMDGMDGFAGGMAVWGFATLAVLAGTAGEPALAGLACVVAAAAAGFLPFNLPPARIFMGDVGSSVLGLLAAGLSLWGDPAPRRSRMIC
jgi:UDP-N-acetylmuramyl pentapeptide phosphotransferase/UDP-N-acetylglucosamine-1-phosphate transferase